MIGGRRTIARIGIALAIGGAAACAGNRARATNSAAATDPCVIGSLPGAMLDTVHVVLSDERYPWALGGPDLLDPRLDHGAPLAPAFVLAQIYETLVRATCTGAVVPALAERWTSDNSGARWTFTLRRDARFADGTAVTAADVAATWTRRRSGGSYVSGEFPLLLSLVAESDGALTVAAEDTIADLPRVYGSVALGVGRISTNPFWPMGTGAYTVDTTVRGPQPRVLRPVVTGARPILHVTTDSTSDRRDLLDRGADLLLTRDPVVVDYARRTAALSVHALAWDRTYVLALTSRVGRTATDVGLAPAANDQAAFRSALARDAVRADARAATPEPEWWRSTSPCSEPLAARPVRMSAETTPRRIVYEPDDPVARSLAERLVALARDGGGQSDVLKALAPELSHAARAPLTAGPAGPASLREGDELAYVIAIPHHVMNRCLALRTLRFHGRWLEPSALIPLIDTRPSLVARRGTPSISVDWEGTLRIHPESQPPAGPP